MAEPANGIGLSEKRAETSDVRQLLMRGAGRSEPADKVCCIPESSDPQTAPLVSSSSEPWTSTEDLDESAIEEGSFKMSTNQNTMSTFLNKLDSYQASRSEQESALFTHASTQTYSDDRSVENRDDLEIFYDPAGFEDLMSEMEVDEFIPWFDRNNNASDNKSDTSELPVPEEFRENQWSLEKCQGVKVGTFGCYYEGATDDKKMHGYGRLILRDRNQFIEGRWDSGRLIELNFTQLTHDSINQVIFIVKQDTTYLVTIREERFLARATASSFRDLNLTAQMAAVKSSLFKKFTVIGIIEDDLRSQRDTALKIFECSLEETASEDADPINRAAILILLSRHSKQNDAKKVLSAMQREHCVSDRLQNAAKNLLEMENALLSRKLDMFNFSNEIQGQRYLDLRGILNKIYSQRITEHRLMLINKCPNALLSMLSALESLAAERIVYITKEDIGIFEHLVSMSDSEHYAEFIEWLLKDFIEKLKSIEVHTRPSKVIPVMFPVYGFLFKSFSEMISEICTSSDCSISDMLKSKSGNWRIRDKITWSQDQDVLTKKQMFLNFFKMSKKKATVNRKSLEVQYKFIFNMLMNYSPKSYNKAKRYEYDFCVLEKDKNSRWWQKGLNFVKEAVGWKERLKDSPEERLVWLYLLDHTVHELFNGDLQTQQSDEDRIDIVDLYAPLLQGHTSFVIKSESNRYESFRVLTHSILRFMISTAPYFRDAQDKPGVDAEILSSQMETITKASDEMDRDPSALFSFKDLIAEYNRYWGLRPLIAVDDATGFFSYRITGVMLKFMNIVKVSLKKSVSIPVLVEYFRFLNDFLDNIKDVDFKTLWFVKSNFYDSAVMERVENKLSSGVNCSYRVVDIDKYIEALGNRLVPEHYILLVVSELLGCVENCLELSRHGEDSQYTQIKCTGMLLDAIRQSFIYLEDQPGYVDFDTFKKESIEPFRCILSDLLVQPLTLSEFKKRTKQIKESFWYIRKMDELGIEQALQKFKSVNSCHISSELQDFYNEYLARYNVYIANYNTYLSGGKSHFESLEYVRQSIDRPEALHFTEWTKQFKTETIPLLLAGLSAVWSILVSKDVSSTKKFLKPHCIQVLCVMRLLSIEESKGASNHLAQVLTGQGKSVILGLLSATLALTGHKVRVLCYSDYLSSRDQTDFKEFFRLFQVDDRISYGTFEDMANVFLNPKCQGIKTSLRELVANRVLSQTEASLGSVSTETKDTVLLIDEVDVFFTDKFYGNVYNSCTTPKIPGLADVQEKMWSIAKGSKYEASEVVRLTKKFIDDEAKSGNTPCREFNAFRYKSRSKPLTLLHAGPDGNLEVREYTNLSLLEEHLLLMAKEALWVGNMKEDELTSDFKINDSGRISMRDENGKFVTNRLNGYRNTFSYFKLKGSEYENKDFNNYGYLILASGRISYARLPSQFQLILGVSGTLQDLSDHEKTGIRSYDINNFSILPSFFGESNLRFDKNSDFLCLNKKQDWLKTIYDKADQIVKSFRAVLIFFDTETKLNLFSTEYKSKFDRFNEITENTKDENRDVYV